MKVPTMTEKQLQEAILQVARLTHWTGYHTFDSRRSHEGFPDLVLARWGVLLFAELKAKTKLSQVQILWGKVLEECAAQNPNVHYRIWTPEHLRNGDIDRFLKGMKAK